MPELTHEELDSLVERNKPELRECAECTEHRQLTAGLCERCIRRFVRERDEYKVQADEYRAERDAARLLLDDDITSRVDRMQRILAGALDFDAYQDAAERTASGENRPERAFLGIAGEAGEVCEARKKFLRGDYGVVEYERRLVGELGGVLWYVAECCTVHGLSLADVAKNNIDTLTGRIYRGVIQGDGDDR